MMERSSPFSMQRAGVFVTGLLLALAWFAVARAQDASESASGNTAAEEEEVPSSGDAVANEGQGTADDEDRKVKEAGGKICAEATDFESAGEGEGKRSSLELREEMLEGLGDQLSRRMRSLKERESALAEREEALAEREKAIGEREQALGVMEELLRMREDVVERREDLPPRQSWKGPEAPDIHGRYAAVLDGRTMQFFHEKAARERVPVASTQKLVTALVVCRQGDLDEMVKVPPEVEDVEPTVVGVKPGERYSRRQLLTALLVRSGNDLAATLAIDHAGSIEAFAKRMNDFARCIGMTDSHFVNPHGLPADGQYSTARDIAIAAYEAYQVPEIREMTRRESYDFTFADGREVTLHNTNRVLGSLEGCNGMKTGFTYAAGKCLVCSARVDGVDRISVILKSSSPHVWEDSEELLRWSLNLEMTGPREESDLAATR